MYLIQDNVFTAILLAKPAYQTGFMGQSRKNHTFFYKNFFIEFYIFLKIFDIFDKNLENFKFPLIIPKKILFSFTIPKVIL